MKEYDVTITETLEMTVTVEAESREEARQKVADNWKNGEYILDAESFKDVEFYPRGRSRDRGWTMNCFFGRLQFPAGEWNVYVPASIVFGRPNTAC